MITLLNYIEEAGLFIFKSNLPVACILLFLSEDMAAGKFSLAALLKELQNAKLFLSQLQILKNYN